MPPIYQGSKKLLDVARGNWHSYYLPAGHKSPLRYGSCRQTHA